MRLAIRVCNSICRSNASAASGSTRSCKYELFASVILERYCRDGRYCTYCPITSPTNRSGLTPSGPNSLINRVSICECFVRTVSYNFYVPLLPSFALDTQNFIRASPGSIYTNDKLRYNAFIVSFQSITK